MPGKLNGPMTAATPSGCRIIISSMPVATSSKFLPCIIMGIPQATSTFSIARRISPFDSAKVLPHSRVIVRAKSSKCSSSRFFSLNKNCTRSVGGVRRQVTKAAAAACAALSTSVAVDKGT